MSAEVIAPASSFLRRGGGGAMHRRRGGAGNKENVLPVLKTQEEGMGGARPLNRRQAKAAKRKDLLTMRASREAEAAEVEEAPEESAEFTSFTRDVAARIIQYHFRANRYRKKALGQMENNKGHGGGGGEGGNNKRAGPASGKAKRGRLFTEGQLLQRTEELTQSFEFNEKLAAMEDIVHPGSENILLLRTKPGNEGEGRASEDCRVTSDAAAMPAPLITPTKSSYVDIHRLSHDYDSSPNCGDVRESVENEELSVLAEEYDLPEEKAREEEEKVVEHYASKSGAQHHHPPQASIIRGPLQDADERDLHDESSDKLKSIMAYLDELEEGGNGGASSLPSSSVEAPLPSRQPSAERVGEAAGCTVIQAAAATRVPPPRHVSVGKQRPNLSPAASLQSMSRESLSTIAPSTLVEGVRSRMETLKTDLSAARERITNLEAEIQRGYEEKVLFEEECNANMDSALEQQQHEHEAAVNRHLAFIDRLLADKDELSRTCSSLAAESRSIESRHSEEMKTLQQEWANELKRQKESWAASEKARRDTWMTEKTREVKEMTVKGLEPEIQRILQRHRREMSRVEADNQAAIRKVRDEMELQHEGYTRNLRERLLKEREDELEKERVKAAARMREQADLNDTAMANQRSVHVQELRAYAERSEESQRLLVQQHEQEVERLRSHYEDKLVTAAAEYQRQRDDEVERLHRTYGEEREGVRSALEEEANTKLLETEARLKESCTRQATEEVAAVVSRVEEDARVAQSELESRFRAREEELISRHTEAMNTAKEREASLLERYRSTKQQHVSAEDGLGSAKERIRNLEQEVQNKAESIAWLERQVNEAKAEVSSRESDIRRVMRERESAGEERLRSVEHNLVEMREALGAKEKELATLRARKVGEMEALEGRVRQIVSRKDETISSLRLQLEELSRAAL